MKKAAIITFAISIGLLLIWIMIAMVYIIFSGFPHNLPMYLNIPAGILGLSLFLACGLFLIAERKAIVIEIKKLF